MKYSLQRILRRLRQAWASNLLFVCLLAYGGFVMVHGINVTYMSEGYVAQLEADLRSMSYSFDFLPMDPKDLSLGPAIPPRVYEAIEAKAGLTLFYDFTVRGILMVPNEAGSSLQEITIDYMSPAYAEQLGIEIASGEAVVGSKALPVLELLSDLEAGVGYKNFSTTGQSHVDPIVVEDEQLTMMTQSFKMRLMSAEEEAMEIHHNAGNYAVRRLDSMILLPLDAYDAQKSFAQNPTGHLYYRVDSDEGLIHMYEVAEQLNRLNTDYEFQASSILIKQNEHLEYATWEHKRKGLLAMYAMLIVCVGIGAVLHLRMKARKRDAAISMAHGSTLRGQMWELIGEQGFLILFGLGVGALCARIWQVTLVNMDTPVPYEIKTLLWVFFMGAAMTFFSSVVGIWALRKMTPMEVLRETA